jgi:hypothetical protein
MDDVHWRDELKRIAEADDLHISPFREDGVTLHPDINSLASK